MIVLILGYALDWCEIGSTKKGTNEFVLFAFLLFTANKSNSSVCFLGESTARQSVFHLYLTFTSNKVFVTKKSVALQYTIHNSLEIFPGFLGI